MIFILRLQSQAKLLLLFILCGFCHYCMAETSSNKDTSALFKNNEQQVVQIEIIELSSGNKSGIGSGFLVARKNTIATNFHVVASAIHKPEYYQIDVITHDKQRIKASIYNFDVVNDLALLNVDYELKPLKTAQQQPAQGDTVYSIGNPSDYGMIVVAGIYNGLTAKSFYQRIHFTGSINPGMSGGPVLNKKSEVVGVNVATGGNALGFLVPLSKLNKLLQNPEKTPKEDYKSLIQTQLFASQDEKFKLILNSHWQKTPLGKTNIASEIAPFIPCWGDSNATDKEALYFVAGVYCSSKEYIYLDHYFNSGRIITSFRWFEKQELNQAQFYNLLQTEFSSARQANRAQEENVSNFHCQQDFHRSQADTETNKVTLCTRAYIDYEDLFDLVFISVSTDKGDAALISQFALTGVSKKNAQLFTHRFMDSSSWN